MVFKKDDYTIELTKVDDMYFCYFYCNATPLGSYWLSEVEYKYLIGRLNKDFYMALIFLDAIKNEFKHMCKIIKESYEE